MNRRKLIGAIVILGFAFAYATFGSRESKMSIADGSPSQLLDKNKTPLEFSEFKGKVVFLNNWASWCPPCVAEMPSIQKLKNRLQTNDVVFVMVSFDEEQEKALAFMEKRGFDFDVYFPGKNYPYMTSSIPATFIIDKDGKVISENIGVADYNNEEVVNQLKALVK